MIHSRQQEVVIGKRNINCLSCHGGLLEPEKSVVLGRNGRVYKGSPKHASPLRHTVDRLIVKQDTIAALTPGTEMMHVYSGQKMNEVDSKSKEIQPNVYTSDLSNKTSRRLIRPRSTNLIK
jgi:hypothetical protein